MPTITFLLRIVGLFIFVFCIAPTHVVHAQVSAEMEVEYVDASGVRRLTPIVDGVTTISGVAPFLIKIDASGTRASTAFAAQSTITDAEAYAFLMVGYRISYGEDIGGTWTYPEGTSFSRDEDTGPPLFSYVYTTAGSHLVQMKARDTLGNEDTLSFTVSVSSPVTTTHIPVSAGSWPTFVSGQRYTLQAGGDYRSFGTIETGGLHNIVFEKTGSGADPRIANFSPDGRSKFSASQLSEFRAAHIRLVNIDIEFFLEGQRGFDYVGVVGGIVRRYSSGGQSVLWHEGTDIMRSNVRFARGLFFLDTEVRSTAAENGYVVIGTFNGLHARNTRFVHAENGPTTYAMLRVYGSNFTFRNNLWFSEVDGGSGNGTLTSLLALDGVIETVWRDDDTVGPINSNDNNQRYGYISEKNVLQHNQLHAEDSYLTNGLASVGGGNPSGSQLVRPRLMGWEDNYFFPTGNVGLSSQNGEVYGEYNFWRNNRKDMGQGAHITATTDAPNRTVGDNTTYNGPVLIENVNTRPVPTSFSSAPAPIITFSASDNSITEGESSTLTWSTTNATACTASNGWSGARATSGTLLVTPTATTTYTLTCTGDGGSDIESEVITVIPVSDSEPEVTPPSSGGGGGGGGGGGSRSSGTKFTANQTVILLGSQTVKDVGLRIDLGTQASSSVGKIVSGATKKSRGITYYQVAFTDGLTGWVSATTLALYKNVAIITPTVPRTTIPNIAPAFTATTTKIQTTSRVNLRLIPGGVVLTQLELGTKGTLEINIPPEVKDGYTWVYAYFGSTGGYVVREFLQPQGTTINNGNALLKQIELLMAEVQRLMKLLAERQGR